MDILISACLAGSSCRYDGKDNFIKDFFEKHKDLNFIKICPEVAGGLSTPRKASEIRGDRVFDIDGNDNTDFFKRGGEVCLKKALNSKVKVAILKAKSPSCGKGLIYDGSFRGKLVEGYGITARMLIDNNIKVFTEKELDAFEDYIETIK